MNGSNEFNEFLEMLGDKVPLNGWKSYRGGLDVHRTRAASEVMAH